MTIQYTRVRVDKIVKGSDITALLIGISAVDDADSDGTTNSAYIDGKVPFSPVKTSLTKDDVDQAETDFRSQTSSEGDTVDTQLANIISSQQAVAVMSEVDYDSLPAS